MTVKPEPWLRGPIPGIPPLLQPAAHAFQMALEDSTAAALPLTNDELWVKPGGAASAGFHLMHLSGSTDRLLTYARGEALSVAQRRALADEQADLPERPPLDTLIDRWRATVEAALAQLGGTPESILQEPRAVGRAGLPSTVLGLLFHAAEHAHRHTGQLVTTAKVVKGCRGLVL
jgi:hypothetical protein